MPACFDRPPEVPRLALSAAWAARRVGDQ